MAVFYYNSSVFMVVYGRVIVHKFFCYFLQTMTGNFYSEDLVEIVKEHHRSGRSLDSLDSTIGVFCTTTDFHVSVLFLRSITFFHFISSFSRDTKGTLRTVPTIVIAHTFCVSRDTRIPISSAY